MSDQWYRYVIGQGLVVATPPSEPEHVDGEGWSKYFERLGYPREVDRVGSEYGCLEITIYGKQDSLAESWVADIMSYGVGAALVRIESRLEMIDFACRYFPAAHAAKGSELLRDIEEHEMCVHRKEPCPSMCSICALLSRPGGMRP